MTTNIRKLTDQEQRQAAKDFYEQWKDRSDEKKDTQSFWLDLLRMVYGVENPSQFINFEKTIQFENSKKFADGYIKQTKILIEQKSGDVDLSKGERQSDDVYLRPDQQARRYANNLPYDEKPKYIIVSNFKEIWIYDENRPHSDPEKILLKDLPKEYYRLQFMVDTGSVHIKKEMELSIKAGEIIGEIYDAIRKQYDNPNDEETLKSLNKLCVRLVFCFYAEDAGLFGKRSAFHDYLDRYNGNDFRDALKSLFAILNQKPENRDKYLNPELAQFPYVNGGLFDGEDIEIPHLTEEIRNLILEKASFDFNWSEISPTIFGAVFESTLNPETRRKGGMHYTSIENIHKVIDPLFYDDLCKEFEEIKSIRVIKTRNQKLEEFRDKLASLRFMDPACGSGNFLTETYLSLRRLENEAIEIMQGGQTTLGFMNPIKVHIDQFYGIEINDFAVTVATTALWIAESQMMKKTEEIMHRNLDFLPLKTYTNIVEGNALQIKWSDVVPAEKLNYIMGNPPFIGASKMTKDQKDEAVSIFGKGNRVNSIDYVGAWYYLASEYIQGTEIQCAFVSTNSITQGEQVAPLWKKLVTELNLEIIFAHRTFKWTSESSDTAAVFCVIIGFCCFKSVRKKHIYATAKHYTTASHINPYLVNGPDVWINSASKPLFDVPNFTYGNKPTDDGNFIFSEDEYNDFIEKYPNLKKIFREYIGAKEFLNSEKRYCLWLKDSDIPLYKDNPEIKRRIQNVKEFREKSTAAPTRKAAERPNLFFSITQKDSNYLCIPEVSTSSRKYIPIGYLQKNVIASNKLLIATDASLYHFGIITSNVHMSWTKTVTGRLGNGFQYSASIVYNNFPWPEPTQKQKEAIEKTAKGILEVRAKYPNLSLAVLYDDITMPADLRKAHQLNDIAVMKAYGFWNKIKSESECVAELMRMYQELMTK